MRTQDGKTEQDPYMCTCGPCRKFWKNSFPDVCSSMEYPASMRAMASSSSAMTAPSHSSLLKQGDRVTVRGKHQGVVRYVGFLDDQSIAPRLFVGVKLDDNVSSLHNGMYKGKHYFTCPQGHGAMIPVNEVRPVTTPNPRPSVSGNSMYPSFKEVQLRRKEREKRLCAFYEQQQHTAVYPSVPSPHISPRHTRATQLRLTHSPAPSHTGDPNDMAVRDQKRKEQKKMAILEAAVESPEEKQFRQWRQSFGGDERMASTLQKLHQAYKDGLSLAPRIRSSSAVVEA